MTDGLVPWSSDDVDVEAEERPWLREEGEPDHARLAFLDWLRDVPAVRSLRAAAARTGWAYATLCKWSSTFRWADRAAAHDAWRERRLERIGRALLDKADLDRTRAVAAGVELLRRSLERMLKLMREDPDGVLEPKREANMLQMLGQLALLQGRPTSISKTEIVGESLAERLDKELAGVGDRIGHEEAGDDRELPPPPEITERQESPASPTPIRMPVASADVHVKDKSGNDLYLGGGFGGPQQEHGQGKAD